jgi:hypothetical protein
MSSPGTPWPPDIDDHVHIKGTRLNGVVTSIMGTGDAQHFTLAVRAPAVTDAALAAELGEQALAARTTYALHELEPVTP